MSKRKRILSVLLIAAMLVGVFSGCGKKQTNSDTEKAKVNLVTNGATEYVIVHGKDATMTEVHAAEELQKYLKLISGADISIVTDDAEEARKEIIVGKTNRETENAFDREELGEDGLIIKTTDEKLWLIGGGDRGTIYSVYTFLEDYLGCGFYTKFVERVPEMKTIALQEIKEDKQIPVFKYRDVAWTDYTDFTREDISVKRKINGAVWERKLSEEVGQGYNWALDTGGHTFSRLVDPSIYYAEHPEYFAMDENGNRIAHGQLCLSNPAIPGIIIESARNWLISDPDSNIIAISQNDLINPCLCDECKKICEEEGGAYSGAILRVVNTVAEDLKKDYPDLKVVTFAYQYSRSAPTKTKPADNVYPLLCTIECCFSHPHKEECDMDYTASYINNSANTFAKDLEDWSKICDDNLWIYDYNCNFNFNGITFPDLDNLLTNYRWYAEHGVTGVMPEGQWASMSYEFGALRSYLLSKVQWNPYMSEAEYYGYMDEFLEAVYGAGWKNIREYIELAEELTKDIHFSISADTGIYYMYPLDPIENHSNDELPKDLTVDMVKNYKEVDWTKYWNWYSDVEENRITVEGEKLFKEAMKLAETESQKKDLEKTYLQIENMKSYFYAKQLSTGEGTMNRLIKQFIQVHEKDFTAKEKETLPAAIDAFAYEQSSSAYAEYNRDLCERMVEWGVITNDNVKLGDFYRFDFTTMPCLWAIDESVEIEDIEIQEVSGDLAKVSVKAVDTRVDTIIQTEFRKLEIGAPQYYGAVGYDFDVAVPKGLEDASYLLTPLYPQYSSITTHVTVEEDGWVYVLTQGIYGIKEVLKRQGFETQALYPQGSLATVHSIVPLVLMGKEVKAGDTISYTTEGYGILIAGEYIKE